MPWRAFSMQGGLLRGDLSWSKGSCRKVKGSLILLNSSKQPHAIADIKPAQVNGV